ncbi:MAG: hypothetical protein JHC82_03480 [Stenotrophomonas sp.]|nr:hypothetical protein [Stenotrophomonas sp.]
MESHYPLSAKRLYALMGERMQDFPPHFIERLERRLEAFETSRTNQHRVMHLRLLKRTSSDSPQAGGGFHPDLKGTAQVAVPIRTLQALASIFEVLHSVHLNCQEVQSDAGFGNFMIEELIVSGRELVRSSGDAMWRPA